MTIFQEKNISRDGTSKKKKFKYKILRLSNTKAHPSNEQSILIDAIYLEILNKKCIT